MKNGYVVVKLVKVIVVRITRTHRLRIAIEKYVERSMHFFTSTFECNVHATDAHTAPSY